MRVDELIRQYHEAGKKLDQAEYFYDLFLSMVNNCDNAGYKFRDIIAIWREDVSWGKNAGKLCEYGCPRFEGYQVICKAIEDAENAVILRTQFKEIIAPYLSEYEKRAEEARKNYEEAKNKVEDAYRTFIEAKVEEKFAKTIFENEYIMSVFLNFLLQN